MIVEIPWNSFGVRTRTHSPAWPFNWTCLLGLHEIVPQYIWESNFLWGAGVWNALYKALLGTRFGIRLVFNWSIGDCQSPVTVRNIFEENPFDLPYPLLQCLRRYSKNWFVFFWYTFSLPKKWFVLYIHTYIYISYIQPVVCQECNPWFMGFDNATGWHI